MADFRKASAVIIPAHPAVPGATNDTAGSLVKAFPELKSQKSEEPFPTLSRAVHEVAQEMYQKLGERDAKELNEPVKPIGQLADPMRAEIFEIIKRKGGATWSDVGEELRAAHENEKLNSNDMTLHIQSLLETGMVRRTGKNSSVLEVVESPLAAPMRTAIESAVAEVKREEHRQPQREKTEEEETREREILGYWRNIGLSGRILEALGDGQTYSREHLVESLEIVGDAPLRSLGVAAGTLSSKKLLDQVEQMTPAGPVKAYRITQKGKELLAAVQAAATSG